VIQRRWFGLVKDTELTLPNFLGFTSLCPRCAAATLSSEGCRIAYRYRILTGRAGRAPFLQFHA
jgi:hypothetical protein